MLSEERAELRRLCDEASPGPWRYGVGPYGWDEGVITGEGEVIITNSGHGGTSIKSEDAAFITAARGALPQLLADLEAAEKRAVQAESEAKGYKQQMERIDWVVWNGRAYQKCYINTTSPNCYYAKQLQELKARLEEAERVVASEGVYRVLANWCGVKSFGMVMQECEPDLRAALTLSDRLRAERSE